MNITFNNFSFKYIEKPILNNVSFSINDSDKIGIVGVNGTGKTTLLKLILGTEKPKSGEIIKSGGMRINYLEQDPIFDENKSLIDIVMEKSTKDFPILEYEANSILSKLGFYDSSITSKGFSGGQKKRLALAKTLVTPADIIILDEPTNHLDNEIISWLEKYLIKSKKGLLMVTHDRYFLQRVCNKMMELDNGKVYLYDANYDNFLELKEKRLEEEAHEKQKLKIFLKQEQDWINRGVEARRTKSKSRIQKFEEMSKIKFKEEKNFELSSINTYLGKKLIELKNGSKSFGENKLFDNFSFILNRTDIIGIVGENGCGKTTLFKILMGEEKLDSGELILGETLNIGYFSQNIELIDPEIKVIDYIEDEASIIETLDGKITASQLLEKFLFKKEIQYTKVKMLSGGEKRRLQLVKTLIKNPNILLFDEPTNDLDLYTLEILEDYLLSFNGPILVVSHDRYFLDKICNKLFIFENKNIKESILSFSEYLESKENEIKNITNETKTYKNTNKFPPKLRNELNNLEDEIPKLEDEAKKINIELNKASTDFHKLMELQEELNDLKQVLEEKTNRYFELLEIKESYEK